MTIQSTYFVLTINTAVNGQDKLWHSLDTLS
jgi:hypothetical protein